MPNFVLGPRWMATSEPTRSQWDSLGRGQTRAQAGSVRVGRWEMRAPAGVCERRRAEAGGRVSVVLAGPWEVTQGSYLEG